MCYSIAAISNNLIYKLGFHLGKLKITENSPLLVLFDPFSGPFSLFINAVSPPNPAVALHPERRACAEKVAITYVTPLAGNAHTHTETK